MGKPTASKQSSINRAGYLDVLPQLDALTVSERFNTDGVSLQFSFKKDTVECGKPTIVIKKAGLVTVGKKGSNERGFKIIKYLLNGGKKGGTFVKCKMALGSADQDDLRGMCKGLLEKIVERRDPVKASQWYQNTFGLEDGTAVFNATQELCAPQNYVNCELCEDQIWDSPSKTFGPFLYGDQDANETWYANVNVHQGFPAKDDKPLNECAIFCFDDKGKMCSNKSDDNLEVYNRSGVPMLNETKFGVFLGSSFYTENSWRMTSGLRIASVKLKRMTRVDGSYVIVPHFNLSTTGNIRLQQYKLEKDDNYLSYDQRDAIMDSFIFEGVSAPSRKRKRVTNKEKQDKAVTKPAKKPIEFEREQLMDSDVEGESDVSSD